LFTITFGSDGAVKNDMTHCILMLATVSHQRAADNIAKSRVKICGSFIHEDPDLNQNILV
jgi:hypothetical protein